MSATAPLLNLRPDDLEIVCNVLRQHVPDREVLAFGSRATWTAKEYSDLDLAILGDEPLPLDVSSALTESFNESNLPFKVDVVDWARIDRSFRRIIRRDGQTVQIPTERSETIDDCCPSSEADSEWRTAKIECIAKKVAMGPFGSNIKVKTFVPQGIPVISGQHLRNVRLDERSGFNFITEKHADKLKNSIVFVGDIVFTHAGKYWASSCNPRKC